MASIPNIHDIVIIHYVSSPALMLTCDMYTASFPGSPLRLDEKKNERRGEPGMDLYLIRSTIDVTALLIHNYIHSTCCDVHHATYHM